MKRQEQPVWICEGCGNPLVGNDGVIAVSYAEINAYEEAEEAWDAEHPGPMHDGADFASHPRRVAWHIWHDRCGGSDQLVNPYDIDSGRIDTWQKVASWSAHLIEKSWIQATTWDSLLYGAGVGEA